MTSISQPRDTILPRAVRFSLAVALTLGMLACQDTPPDETIVPDAPPAADPPGPAADNAAPVLPTDTVERPPPVATDSPAPPGADTLITLHVHFTRDERQEPLPRDVPPTQALLRAAVEQQLRGPTPAERAAGFTSWFSEQTAGAIRRVVIEEGGRAIIDFEDLRAIIPNASTSAGSAMLIGELNATVFQFPTVRSVEYRLEGSCEGFWNWLQSDCQVVSRP